MARKRTLTVKCPICKKPVKTTDEEFPFCSPRCRLIDLGKWASGGLRDLVAGARQRRRHGFSRYRSPDDES